jgi:hypothetical protein
MLRRNSAPHFDVDGPVVVEGPPPLQELSIACELQPGEIDHRTARRVLAGNPLRVIKCQRTGARRNGQLRVENFAWGIAGIERDRDVGRGVRRRI